MDWKTHIVADTSILAGKPIIKGTRLSVDFILSLFAQGWTEQQVLENYPQLTLEDLKAVFAFAQTCLAEENYMALGKLG
jgi:uncharacterized protein (DUF433 family)